MLDHKRKLASSASKESLTSMSRLNQSKVGAGNLTDRAINYQAADISGYAVNRSGERERILNRTVNTTSSKELRSEDTIQEKRANKGTSVRVKLREVTSGDIKRIYLQQKPITKK